MNLPSAVSDPNGYLCPDVTRRLLVSSQGAGWEGLTLEQYEAAPGEKSQPPQRLHYLCLNLGERCDLWQQRDGQARHHIQTYGEAVFMPAGYESRWKWTTLSHALYLLMEPELVSRTAAEIGSAEPELVNSFGASDPRLLHLALALNEEAQTGGANGPLFAQCLSTAVAAHLLTHHSSAPLTAKPDAHGLSPSQIKRVTDHVKDNLHSGLGLAEIAETVHISPFHFARQFKRATGKTLHGFVLECRVDAAKRLLRRQDLSVSQIAGEVGFAQQSHLAAHFKRTTGLSPLAFRRQFLPSKTHESAQNAQEFD
jgi:AraC family transcriptional regulator